MQSFSLLLLGTSLATLATLNFSLAFVVGVLASPLSFVRPLPGPTAALPTVLGKVGREYRYGLQVTIGLAATVLYTATSPPVVLYALCWYFSQDVGGLLLEMAKGWSVQGVYTSFVIWAVWWPAWVVGGIALFSGGGQR